VVWVGFYSSRWYERLLIPIFSHNTIDKIPVVTWQSVLDTTLCDKVCQWLATGRWFSSDTPVSSTNKTDCHDITEILLKVALNTITPLNLLELSSNIHQCHLLVDGPSDQNLKYATICNSSINLLYLVNNTESHESLVIYCWACSCHGYAWNICRRIINN
jgi:hypothetical protein